MKNIVTGLKVFAAVTLLTGVVYPLLVTLIAQAAFNDKANGSFYEINGRTIGSKLIAQNFDQDKYFWPRPSAVKYEPMSSGASNLSATSGRLKADIAASEQKLGGVSANNIPSDLLYASGSGLDPDISPESARFQVDRILKARKLDSARKADIIVLINRLTKDRDLKILGEERVNVLELNIGLDALTL